MVRRLSSFLLVAALNAAIGCGDDDAEGSDSDASTESSTGHGVCGDGTLDEGEKCDDGNKVSGDGCSSTCTKEDAATASGKGDAGSMDAGARDGGGSLDSGRPGTGSALDAGAGAQGDAAKNDAGRSEEDAGGNEEDAGSSSPAIDGGSEPQVADLCTGEPANDCDRCACTACESQFAACRDVEGTAQDGPGAGRAKSDLCQAVVRCGQEHGCRGEACFCGSTAPDGGVDLVGCLTDAGPQGPCKAEIFAASETDVPTTVATRRGDTNFAISFANQVSTCSTNSCADACGQ